MVIAESRPFRTPAASSVVTDLDVVWPTTDLHQLSEVWSPGDDVVIRASATLAESFWHETGISPGEDVGLVAIVSCMPARTRWRAQARFNERDGVWRADLDLKADGSELAVELTADLWVVGPGRTGSADPINAIHESARLWQLPSPLTLRLERDEADFPTSATSFGATGRRSVPWTLEIATDAEPHWSISSSIRLFVNTDFEVCRQIVDGDAPEDVYKEIECDIHLGVLHFLSGWRTSIRADRMQDIADDDFGSVAALGLSITSSLGLTLEEGCRLATEDPMTLLSRSREALALYGRVSGK